MSVFTHMPICGQWFEKQLWTHVLVIAQMSQCAQSFQTHQWLLILVCHCELMCPCASFWPMVWYIPINSETGCSLWAYVSVCTHVPPCGQCFDTYLNPLRLCELMCQFVPMCSQLANVLIHTYNFSYCFAVLSSYDCMCPCNPTWLMV